jgi:hypothetical protein
LVKLTHEITTKESEKLFLKGNFEINLFPFAHLEIHLDEYVILYVQSKSDSNK